MKAELPRFMPTQPQRCAGGEPGIGGHCLACGAHLQQLCQAPVEKRYGATKKRRRA